MHQGVAVVVQDGQPCRNAVNKSQCSYCEYHVQAEKKKLGSGRAQLRGNFLKTSLRNATAQYAGKHPTIILRADLP